MLFRLLLALSFLAVGFIPAASLQPKPKKYALLIGVYKYNHQAMNQPGRTAATVSRRSCT